ncbi:helix-turn-helix transcriptional regulator [Nocardia puris]|uniref:TetR family transcriptional regulator n=1 Tax=Nocardia puris TaxID=208602 RepID=A0A366DVQ2_9NOCA|nr:TetR family transcriptional regulator [Nocardia puris]MBF6210086.1 helix-turn-helix transcriptional regulator [Nocardia puris]MBF6368277.1 helix-turn-helix transcriptional regulator [Nocardia puris]MBF6458004.1 helix-turn-helix transcriptional regulator [Nocardia puris]RBO94166.1 TetR family transcriptional regulator [Nocardia puris]
MAAEDPRTALLDAGERLIAARGVDVPLRDIAAAAGQRNNSAVHYYFESRTGLIEAIVDRKMNRLEERRLALLAAREADGTATELRTLVTLLIGPMVELVAEDPDSHYGRFLEVIRTHPAIADARRLAGADRAAVRILATRLDAALTQLTPRHRRRRLETMTTLLFALLADYERAIQHGTRTPDLDTDIAELTDMLVAMLSVG